MTPSTSKGPLAKTMRPLVAAWKQAFHLATAESASYNRGLNLQRNGAVSQVSAATGQFDATVTGKNRAAHRAHITVPTLNDTHWQQLADQLANDTGAVADLLTGKVPASIADPGHAGGPSIVPQAHEIDFFCTCLTGQQQPARLCEHSAALGHAIADRLMTSASALLTARGMPTRDLAEALRGRLTSHRPGALPVDASGSVRADDTYTLWANRAADEPAEGYVLDQPEPVVATLTDPPNPGPRARDLAWLVEDASARARALLDGHVPPPHDALADAVRLLASPHSITRLPETAARTDITEHKMRRLLIAYRHGGPAGTHAATGAGSLPSTRFIEARDAVQRSNPLAAVETADGCLMDTSAGIQLRPGPDGHWYPFARWREDWRPVPGHSADPTHAYRAARRSRAAHPGRA